MRRGQRRGQVLQSRVPPSSLERCLGGISTYSRNSREYEALEGLTGSGLRRTRLRYCPAQYSLQDDVVAVICLIFHCVQNKTYFILEVLNHLITNEYMDAGGALFKDLVNLSG